MVLSRKHPKPPKPPKPDKPTGPSGPTAPTAVTGPTKPVPVKVTANTPFRETGNTDRASFRAALRRSINGQEPPPYREADAIYEELAPYGLTRLGAAMAWIERKNDTYSGYYPQSNHNLWAVKTPNGAWAKYGSYREAAKAWAALVLGKTYADLHTLSQFIHRYAPSFENDTEKYVRMAVDEINALPSIDGDAPEPPKPQKHPIDVIVGGAKWSSDYGFLDDAGLNYYAYGVGHGTQRATQHTGIDISVPLGTTLHSPINGVVDCVGGRGNPRWGQGCGAYADTITGGVGNITIYGDSGHKLVLGHSNKAFVEPGQRVAAGQRVGTSGGMNGPHTHVEVAVERNGTYWLVEPVAALREAMGGKPVETKPDTVPYNWNAPDRNEFVVTADIDGIVARQRADPASPKLYDVENGSTFTAIAIIPGNDKQLWWLATDLARIPISGTRYEVEVG